MIIVRLMGGLGNQMFQYALARHLSMTNNCELKLDIAYFSKKHRRPYGLGHFNIIENFASKKELFLFKNINNLSKKPWSYIGKLLEIKPGYIEEKIFGFNQSILELSGDIYLDGYWQSERFFLPIKNALLGEFSLKNNPSNEFLKLEELAKTTDSVAVHVRRGDYVSNERIFNVHGVCPPDYFRTAISEVMNRVANPQFFIFSDEIKWVKANLDLPSTSVFVSGNRSIKDHEELALMSKCRHNIISNSSFSWWGAWLNKNAEKIVIAPKKWFSDTTLDSKDIIPEQWMKI